MYLPSLTTPIVEESRDPGTYCVYVGLEGLQGSVRFLADCQDGIPRRIAVLADGIGLAGWLVQNLYSR